jgi:phospholipid/cholesterol/gamma-HCH transport system permease protein
LVQMEQTGLNAMPIVGLLSFLIGVVMAYQGADQLRRFGAEIYTVNLLGVSILRELGVLLAAIIIAGRSGSAFTAQIGTMQVNQEIDALRTLGLDPVEVLVLPRLFGLVLTLPLLVFFADAMGLLGGGLMTWASLGITTPQFLEQLRGAITEWTLWVGVIKAPFFAAIIAMIGCYEGFNVTGSADSVGRLTTQSVVESIFVVIVADAAFSILFSFLKI